jgi:glycosyltransferase involved in cell wall biosynthesis
MKIALLQSPFIPLNLDICGGLERVELAELEGLRRRGHDVRLYVSRLTGSHSQIDTIKDWNPRHPILMWKFYLDFWSRTRNCDVLHGHYAPPLLTVAPERSILHLHGLSISWLPYYRYLLKRYQKAHYIACAQHIKDKYLKIYPDLFEDHIDVLYNGTDTELFKPRNGTALCNSDKVRISFHGKWEKAKGIYDILSAARKLSARRSNFELYLVGTPYFEGETEESKDIERDVQNAAAEFKNIIIVGELSHNDLAKHLQTMDIGICPSTYEDPFPLVPLEIMSSGLPVICYGIGGFKESVAHEQTGFLAENGSIDELTKYLDILISNYELRKKIGSNARRHVQENFTWERHANQLLQIYEKVTDSR